MLRDSWICLRRGWVIHSPGFTSGNSFGAGTQNENDGVTTSDATGGFWSDPINVETFSGLIIASQQLLDRGGYDGQGGNFDAIAAAEMWEQAKAEWDIYVINQAIANATVVTQTAALSFPLLLANLTAGRENMSNTAGYYGKATHVFSTSNVTEWAFKQVDSEQRPIIVPDAASLIAASPAGQIGTDTTFTGVWLNRQPWYEDDNIPLASGNQQVLLVDTNEVFTWKSPTPSVVCHPETSSTSLSVVIRSHFYGASAVRHLAAVQQITGNGYANIS